MQPPPAAAEREELIRLTADYIADGIFSGAHPAAIADWRISWLEELRERYGDEVGHAIYAAGYQRVYGSPPPY